MGVGSDFAAAVVGAGGADAANDCPSKKITAQTLNPRSAQRRRWSG